MNTSRYKRSKIAFLGFSCMLIAQILVQSMAFGVHCYPGGGSDGCFANGRNGCQPKNGGLNGNHDNITDADFDARHVGTYVPEGGLCGYLIGQGGGHVDCGYRKATPASPPSICDQCSTR